jgi:hypothetical protein
MNRRITTAVTLSAALWLTTTARADALTLAQICYLEATWSKPDCSAIAGVGRSIEARTGKPWLQAARRYSALDKGSRRAREVRAFTADGYPGAGPSWLAKWHALLEYAQRIVDGHEPSPCRGARDWGGLRIAADRTRAAKAVANGRWQIVKCSEQTSNTFFGRR